MNILAIAAHPDDEVLGCGGTLARWAEEGHSVHVLLLADGESSRSVEQAAAPGVRIVQRECAAARARDILGCRSLEMLVLPDNRLDGMPLLDVIRPIEAAIARLRPRTVLTHHAGDLNIDHRIVHAAVVTACRPQAGHPVEELLFFEIPSSTEWQTPGSAHPFQPNVFIDISQTAAKKRAALQAYADEMRDFPHPRSFEALDALARWRGATVGVEAAEAFVLGRRIVPCQPNRS